MQPLHFQVKEWMQTLKSYCQQSFKTIRIRPNKIKPSAADKLLNVWNKLNKCDKEMNTELGKKIADKLKEEKIMKIKMFKKHSNESSANNMHNMWKLKEKLFPKRPLVSRLPNLTIKAELYLNQMS